MDKRAEAIAAAKSGLAEYLRTTRGANAFGSNARLIDTKKGFVLVYGSDDRMYFEPVEM